MNLKLVLLWVSACAFVLGLGLFATASSAARPADRAAIDQTTDQTTDHGTQSVAPDDSCHGQAADQLSLAPSRGTLASEAAKPQETCSSTEFFTCCRCGGCGCRPRNLSPTNWCGC